MAVRGAIEQHTLVQSMLLNLSKKKSQIIFLKCAKCLSQRVLQTQTSSLLNADHLMHRSTNKRMKCSPASSFLKLNFVACFLACCGYVVCFYKILVVIFCENVTWLSSRVRICLWNEIKSFESKCRTLQYLCRNGGDCPRELNQTQKYYVYSSPLACFSVI